MTAALVFFAIIGLVWYALERNHSRNGRPTFTGSGNVVDRDFERIQADVAGAAGRTAPTVPGTRHPGRPGHPGHLRAA